MDIKQKIVEYFINEAEVFCNCTAPRISFIKSYNMLHDYDKAIESIIELTGVEDDFANYSALLGETITRIILEDVSMELNKPREDLRNVIRFHSLEIVENIIWFILEVENDFSEDSHVSHVIKVNEMKNEDILKAQFLSFKQSVSSVVTHNFEV